MNKEEPKQEEEEEEESLKEELKEEGTYFVKDLVVGAADAVKRAGHGLVNIFTERDKVKDLKKDVADHAAKIKETMKD